MAALKIETRRAAPAELRTAMLVVQHFERDAKPTGPAAEIDRIAGGVVARVLERGDFSGRKDELLVLYPSAEAPFDRILLIGLGRREDFTLERLRRAIGQAVRQAERMGVGEIGLSLGHADQLSEHMGGYYAALGAVEAAALAAWDFRELKTVSDPDQRPQRRLESVVLFASDEAREQEYRRAARHGEISAAAANLARELAIRPGNVATPTYLAETALRLGAELGLKAEVLDRAALEREGMHALLAVARGSEEEPRFITLEYRGAGEAERPLVLVGKGVTFDSGGISIKPAEKMEDMKYDMSGAAGVLGAMRGIAQLGLHANVVGLIPSTENLPSGRAVKPGDVIGSHLGKTIEVVNTDAEGRLILADALSYSRRYEPAAVVDAATLTGAVVVALGHHAIGLMGNDGDLMDELRAAGLRTGERCWPLPLWDEYREQIDSTVADIKNTGGRPAGSITAGWFLKEFVGTVPWAHLDIAGTAYRDEPAPYLRKGPTGVPTRLFIEWVRSRSE